MSNESEDEVKYAAGSGRHGYDVLTGEAKEIWAAHHGPCTSWCDCPDSQQATWEVLAKAMTAERRRAARGLSRFAENEFLVRGFDAGLSKGEERGRKQERDAVVAWLQGHAARMREYGGSDDARLHAGAHAAAALFIERGIHLKDTPDPAKQAEERILKRIDEHLPSLRRVWDQMPDDQRAEVVAAELAKEK